MSWTTRLVALGTHQPTELAWPQVWALVARATRLHGEPAAAAQVWSLKLASWIVSLDGDPKTCRHCGALIEAESKRAAYCAVACRKAAFRCRQASESTPFEHEVARAKKVIAELSSEAALAERAIRRWAKQQISVNPPDWTRFDHVPSLPAPCQGGCRAVCDHTGAICLYARTARPIEDEDE